MSGVWVAGNAANPRAQVITAAGDGSTAAAIALNADLVVEYVALQVRRKRPGCIARGRRLGEFELGELTAGGDSCFGEDVAQVKGHRTWGDPDLRGNVFVGEPGGHELGDLELHRSELHLGGDVALAGCLAGSAELLGRAADERLGVLIAEGLQSLPQVLAGVDTTLRATQPLPVGEMGASLLQTATGALVVGQRVPE